MKKYFILSLLSILICSPVKALEPSEELTRTQVTLVNCESSTSMWVKSNGIKKRIRLLAYDPSKESMNQEIDEYACKLVRESKKITIISDPASTFRDQYNRELVWVYLDDVLLQEKLLEKGYGQVNYVTGDYQNLDNLCDIQANAIKNKLGIWESNPPKEKYCQSGISNGNNKELEKDTNNQLEKKDTKQLWYMVFVSSGIVLLLFIMRQSRRENNEEKR